MAVVALVMYLVMFLIVFVLRTVIQKRTTGESGVRAGGLSSSFGSREWLAAWLLVAALLAGLAAPILEMTGLDPITSSNWVRGSGIVVAAVGIALTFLAQVSMGTEWRIGIDVDERTGLVTGGAFAIVRNPIFSAMLVTATGLALIVPNPVSIIGLVVLALAIELQVRSVEEPHLNRLHGTEYARYASRVGRFVPGIGRRRSAAGARTRSV